MKTWMRCPEHVFDVATSGADIPPEYIANQIVAQVDRIATARGKLLTPDMIRMAARAQAEQARKVVAELERIAAEREGH